MASASGIAKVLAYKKETTFGVLAGAAGGKQLRRVKSNISPKKQTYESNEIRTDQQDAVFVHGLRSVGGDLDCELSPGSYQDPIGSLVRKAWAAVTSLTGLSLTIAASGSLWTVTRGAGDFLASGIKIGMPVRITAGSFNALNLNKNLLVVAMTTTALTVATMNGTAMQAEGPIASATIAVPGRYTYVPTTGHTDESYTIEHWFSDIAQSEVYTGCKFTQMDVNLPPTGLATCKFNIMGKDLGNTGVTQYFTSPTAPSSTSVVSAVNGVLVVGGAPVAVLTGMSFTLSGNYSAEPIVGSNTYSDIDRGRVKVQGQATIKFLDATFRNYFTNETEVTLVAAFANSVADAADFITFTFPRVKFNANDKDDGEKAIIQTVPFKALIDTTGGAGTSREATTLMIHDSAAV